MLSDLSYRLKMPLAFVAAIVLTAVALTVSTAMRAYDTTQTQLVADAGRVGAVLANALSDPIRKDAVWAAYLTVQTLASAGDGERNGSPVVVVLDTAGRVFVSSDPERYPLLSPGDALIEGVGEPAGEERHLAVRVPIAPDGDALGDVVLLYPHSRLLPPLYDIVAGTLWAAAAVLVLLVPIAWFWGRRLAAPLVHLAESMPKVARSPLEQLDLPAVSSRDEIGRLTAGFSAMLSDLAEKQEMERRMIATERLAAVGRVAAGVAHEINNPLGGMLNALSTYRRHDAQHRLSEKTVSLLERGLQQIRDTVAALLVEAKIETHPLTPEDIEDVRTLVLPEVKRKRARLDWSSDLSRPMALPSTQVRQVLFNLLLNAIKAIGEDGTVGCNVRQLDDQIRITVEDDGTPITSEQAERLFEPFSGTDANANGLGLWVTYQIVQQFRGEIVVDSNQRLTRFSVALPCTA